MLAKPVKGGVGPHEPYKSKTIFRGAFETNEKQLCGSPPRKSTRVMEITEIAKIIIIIIVIKNYHL